ncbi:MAG: 4-hydroxy-tetrahydrodipicolinate synthase [Actinomycetia bacterium]|nr:4-hydroxy-tetrahydrodipicolinate synthase [Actinomycetes bacterium]MCP4961371.1 4-hydroxy-tetrahydrodipicolinate synthase [Actinomycetes bacterium]
MSGRFGRVVPAMITPFADDGSLDVDGAVALAKWLIEQGSDGLVITGTTGEGPTITDEEDWELWRSVVEAVTVPVVIGSGTNDTAHSVEQSKMAKQCGADGLLVVTPYYNRPSQAGIYAHFESIAGAADLPVVVYDIPPRTNRKVETDTLLAMMHQIPNIVALKDAAGNPGETARVIAEAPDGFDVYSGDDSLTLPLLSVGAVGVVSVCAHWTSPDFVEMFAAFDAGDFAGARRVNARMLDSYAFESSDIAPNPVPTKAMLRTLGRPAGEPRLPMGPTPVGLEDRAREVYAALVASR